MWVSTTWSMHISAVVALCLERLILRLKLLDQGSSSPPVLLGSSLTDMHAKIFTVFILWPYFSSAYFWASAQRYRHVIAMPTEVALYYYQLIASLPEHYEMLIAKQTNFILIDHTYLPGIIPHHIATDELEQKSKRIKSFKQDEERTNRFSHLNRLWQGCDVNKGESYQVV
ncbi:hypothetical protein VNO77_39042 [Canavalia gladiata]|uniref:Uncharacterized protein n=1 Tax=Canavalia gladiata TaxID=3824 RepID=A0AAN9K9Q4_CANGL